MFLFTTVGVAQNLTVISYNIRYNSQSDGEDIWDLRKGELVGQINQHSPDSFGVQEATQIQIQYILEALPEYGYVGVGRDDGASKGEYSAVFYLKEKFKSFGWEVLEVDNGNSLDKIYEALKIAKESSKKGKPIAILMKTVMGNGVDFMMHTHEWHGKAPNDDQLEIALNQNPETLGDY